jgi:endonuclease VIII-like 1
MMDQKYFNGIGNYLRAEILHRANVNPFLPASEIITYHLLELCHDVCQESYLVGGGELKDWDNPFKRGYGRGRINEKMGKLADTSFRDWLQCYGKSGHSIEDSKGRRFWFDKKWLNE